MQILCLKRQHNNLASELNSTQLYPFVSIFVYVLVHFKGKVQMSAISIALIQLINHFVFGMCMLNTFHDKKSGNSLFDTFLWKKLIGVTIRLLYLLFMHMNM